MQTTLAHDKIVKLLLNSIEGNVKSIFIIGSYLVDMKLREGSDIDIVVVVEDLNATTTRFGSIFYKDGKVLDPEGERWELNTKLQGITLDITIIDHFNTPNNPLTDWYENHLGWCKNAYTLYGQPPQELFHLGDRIAQYTNIRQHRLDLVEEKILMTKRKITEQGRRDLHILYELQRYIFIRECIKRGVFNALSIKHPEKAIPDFEQVYTQELADCGIELTIKRRKEGLN